MAMKAEGIMWRNGPVALALEVGKYGQRVHEVILPRSGAEKRR